MTYAGAEMLVEINRGDLKLKTLLGCITQKWTLEHKSITFVWLGKKGGFQKAVGSNEWYFGELLYAHIVVGFS